MKMKFPRALAQILRPTPDLYIRLVFLVALLAHNLPALALEATFNVSWSVVDKYDDGREMPASALGGYRVCWEAGDAGVCTNYSAGINSAPITINAEAGVKEVHFAGMAYTAAGIFSALSDPLTIPLLRPGKVKIKSAVIEMTFEGNE
jgi:hypothetical protein